MRATTSRKCTDKIGTCEGLQAESEPMRLEHARDYKKKCTDEIRTCEGLQSESIQMRVEHMRDYNQKVHR